MFTNIKSLDKYFRLIGVKKENVLAIWEQGSFLEGIQDVFSDRDFVIIWKDSIPNANKRLRVARSMNVIIHEIKDVPLINRSFDLFSDNENLFNLSHCTENEGQRYYNSLFGDIFPSDLEEVLMSVSAFETAKIHYQKESWFDSLKEKVKLNSDARKRIIDHYSKKISQDLKLLKKSKSRGDFLEFIKYFARIARFLQLIYLLKNNLSIVSQKHFKKRFARLENGDITKLVGNFASRVNVDQVYRQTLKVASQFGIKQSEKFKA